MRSLAQRRLVALLLLSGCSTSFEPPSFLSGLRILAVKAEPPEIAPGDATTMMGLAVDTRGDAVALTWAACTVPALPNLGSINPDCFTGGPAPYLAALGSGPSIQAVVPDVNVADFGPPDASGGIYLPVILEAQASGATVNAAYHLRLARAEPPNNNPTLAAVLVVPADGSAPITTDEAVPIEVGSGDKVTLRAIFTDGSSETYGLTGPGQSGSTTEVLRVSWFATAGSWSEDATGQSQPDTVWRADSHLPAANAPIDIYVVGRDDRGGTDYLHRTLVVR